MQGEILTIDSFLTFLYIIHNILYVFVRNWIINFSSLSFNRYSSSIYSLHIIYVLHDVYCVISNSKKCIYGILYVVILYYVIYSIILH